MQEFKGTPGEWEAMNSGDIFGPLGGDSGDGVICDERDGWQVAEVGHYSSFVDGELVEQGAAVREANLALLLAAKDLLEAALFAERRSKQQGEGNLEFFERLADEFYRRHGYLAPGKDDPLRSVSIEEAKEEWGRFLNEPGEARRAAIAKALNTDTTER